MMWHAKDLDVSAMCGEAAEHAVAPAARVLYVSDTVLVTTWFAFQEGARLGVESSVRWAGPAALSRASHQVVTTVVNPLQRVDRGYFEIPHEGTREMGEALVDTGVVNVAQVHTHPGKWVGHSGWDDDHAYSRREGALSVVWPWYGRVLPPIEEWGIHEHRSGAWVRLDAAAAAMRIVVLPGLLNLRGALEVLSSGFVDSELECDGDGPDGYGENSVGEVRRSKLHQDTTSVPHCVQMRTTSREEENDEGA